MCIIYEMALVLACLAITGVMKMTPTAAVEVLVGLNLLHVINEAET